MSTNTLQTFLKRKAKKKKNWSPWNKLGHMLLATAGCYWKLQHISHLLNHKASQMLSVSSVNFCLYCMWTGIWCPPSLSCFFSPSNSSSLFHSLANILFLIAPCHSDQAGMNIQWARRHLFLLRGRALARGSLKSASPLPSMHPLHHLRTPPYPPLPQHLGLVTGGYPTDPSGWNGWPVCPIGVG